jgi:hypothetical protein
MELFKNSKVIVALINPLSRGSSSSFSKALCSLINKSL